MAVILVITVLKGIRLIDVEGEGLVGKEIRAVGRLIEQGIAEVGVLRVKVMLVGPSRVVVVATICSCDGETNV